MAGDVELKPQVYKDPRPPEHFARFHELVRHHEPEWIYEVVRIVTLLHALITFRARAIGAENVPNGPVILAPNHASFMDHFFTGVFVRRRVQFMAKSQLFSPGPMQWIYSHGGVFPVRRGHHDEEAFITAFKILERGGAVVMYCEGGRSRTGRLADTAKPGIGRLALESGVPVVPVAILGSHQVRNWKRLRFPKVTIWYGEPFRFEHLAAPTREEQQEAADLIFDRIKALHAELSRLGHRGALRASTERRRSGADPGPPHAQAASPGA
jgi:1-acyl-sn-glycerol-3-phosphate acyltransferase